MKNICTCSCWVCNQGVSTTRAVWAWTSQTNASSARAASDNAAKICMCTQCRKETMKNIFTYSCWVCARQYHTSCVGLDNPNQRFICTGCQRKVQERTVARKCLIINHSYKYYFLRLPLQYLLFLCSICVQLLCYRFLL